MELSLAFLVSAALMLFLTYVVPTVTGVAVEGRVTAHDFGVVDSDVVLFHAFAVSNGGQSPVCLVGVRSSCSSCSFAEIECPRGDCQSLMAGQTAFLKVKVDAGKNRGKIKRKFALEWRKAGEAVSRWSEFEVTAVIRQLQ